MIGSSKERTERFFLAGASTGVAAAGWTGASGASIAGATLALGNGRTSAVPGAFEDIISLWKNVSQTEPFGSM